MVILAQRQIGWRNFLDGLISIEWEKYQMEHFKVIGSHKSASLWASKAIRACWEYNAKIWMARNEQLHKTERIKDLEGRKCLIKAIEAEYAVGLSALPTHGFSWMFRKKKEALTKESCDVMRNWLGIIKQGRIVHRDPRQVIDEFYEDGALKKLLALVELTDEELLISDD